MCAINCSGGCKRCAPDEHAASEAISWLEVEGWPLKPEAYERLSTFIAKEVIQEYE